MRQSRARPDVRCHTHKFQRKIDQIAAAVDCLDAQGEEFNALIAALDDFGGDADLEDYDCDLEDDDNDRCQAGDDGLSPFWFHGAAYWGAKEYQDGLPARYELDQTKPPLPPHVNAIWAVRGTREVYLDPLKLRAEAERTARECRA